MKFLGNLNEKERQEKLKEEMKKKSPPWKYGPRSRPDPTLVRINTRVPLATMKRFKIAIDRKGDKIQTVIKDLMEGYADKVLDEGSKKNE